MTTRAEVDRVLNAFPGLGVHGFEVNPPMLPGPDFHEQVTRVRCWFAVAPQRRALLTKRNSYFWKHRVEEATSRYISNGAVIVAAVLEGFEPIRSNPGPNCRFIRA